MNRFYILAFLLVIHNVLLGQNTELFYKHYSTGNFEEALIQSEKLMKFYSDKPEIVIMHGRVLVDLDRFKDGEPFLKEAIKMDDNKTWISAWAWAYLGHSNFMTGNYIDSEKALKKCLSLNATQNVNKYANRRLFAFGYDSYFSNWKILETEHLRFHFQTPSEINDLEKFAQLREDAFLKISKDLNPSLPKKIDFFVWNNAEEPKQKFFITLGFANPEFACVYTHKNQTVGHEITHVITHYTGKVAEKTGLINEGVAVYFNQNNTSNLDQVKVLMKKNSINEISVKKIWKDWQSINQDISYPLAGAFIEEFVNKFGFETLKKILLNQTYKNAKNLLGDSLDSFITDFENKLMQANLN